MHDDQVHIDLAMARELVHRQFPRWQDLPIEPVVSDGTVNAIFRVGSELSARFPLRRQDPATERARLLAEDAAMRELAEHSPFPAPEPVALGEPGGGYPMPWSVQTWLPGEVASPGALAHSVEFARDLATLIRALRAVDTRGRHHTGTYRGGDLTGQDEWMATCLEQSAGLLDVQGLAELWGRLRGLPPSGPDVMCHGDLIPPNLLVRGEHIVGVLDGGGFAAADPALDLVAAWHHLDRDARQVLRTELECSDVEWWRGAAWAFAQAMGLVWYYATTNPGMSALGRSTLDRLLDDDELRGQPPGGSS